MEASQTMKKLAAALLAATLLALPVQAAQAAPSAPAAPTVDAAGAVLMEKETGTVLYEQNAHDKLEPASVTKVMTLLLVMEAIDSGSLSREDLVTVSAYAASMGYPGAEYDADRIDRVLTEERNRNLRARPLLKLMVSDVDVEAACCKRMLDELLEQNIVFTETMQGPALLGEDRDGMDAVLYSCPFCGAKLQFIPHDHKW